MKKFGISRIIDYVKFGLKYKYTYFIVLFFLILFAIILTLSHFYSKLKFSDSLFSSLMVTFLLDLLCLMFKWGFLRNSISRFKEGRKNSKERSDELRMKKMNPTELRAHKIAKQKVEEQELKAKTYKSNLGWYFILITFFIAILITIPFII
ncbi:hypothetical protein [Mycoplasmopsis alligatoris]|uniref:DUF3899 domain-containing protein n=1 Tax=Mycoplasmopsis alligatoris A21JP2 TaxID=747682 RepID=D4XVB9_9BACT|nr:hypothetical protein [Mycoplasmopsis alligatoris]EFF41591.1 hypothetical protein MALL_0665 [Mycoplasmopsis alligatoris A21JP2]